MMKVAAESKGGSPRFLGAVERLPREDEKQYKILGWRLSWASSDWTESPLVN